MLARKLAGFALLTLGVAMVSPGSAAGCSRDRSFRRRKCAGVAIGCPTDPA